MIILATKRGLAVTYIVFGIVGLFASNGNAIGILVSAGLIAFGWWALKANKQPK